MSDKQKKFEPAVGWMLSIHHQSEYVRVFAEALAIDAVELGKTLERVGLRLEPDPFDFSADAWKLIDIKKREAVKNVQE